MTYIPTSRTFIIAEAGVNHNGSLDIAKQLVDAAVEAGADAVKFQSFDAKELAVATVDKAPYQKALTGSAESQLQMLERLQLDADQHMALRDYADRCGIEFMSAPFDIGSLRMLLDLHLKRIKVPSGELTNAPLLFQMGKSGLPIILSTGMSSLVEIGDTLDLLSFAACELAEPKCSKDFDDYRFQPKAEQWLKQSVTLLQCTSAYPTPFSEINLRVLETLRQHFGLQVGLSDHSEGLTVPIAAVALGAVVVEKHLTLSRQMSGPDHLASLEPDEFRELVRRVREVELSLGSTEKIPVASEVANQQLARKYLVARSIIKTSDVFTTNNLTTKRSASGLSARFYWDLLGKVAKQNYQVDQAIDPAEIF
jgi:N-acetylneuraminate synthase